MYQRRRGGGDALVLVLILSAPCLPFHQRCISDTAATRYPRLRPGRLGAAAAAASPLGVSSCLRPRCGGRQRDLVVRCRLAVGHGRPRLSGPRLSAYAVRTLWAVAVTCNHHTTSPDPNSISISFRFRFFVFVYRLTVTEMYIYTVERT